MSGLRWTPDKFGDALWRGEEFLGSIYDRNPYRTRPHTWRVLAGEDLVPIGDVEATPEQPDARMGARAFLEAHVGLQGPLPTAAQLLDATDPHGSPSPSPSPTGSRTRSPWKPLGSRHEESGSCADRPDD